MRPPHDDDVQKRDALNDELDRLRREIDMARNAADRRSQPERRTTPRAAPDRRRTER
jgi:hypothetical protein